MPIRLSIEKRSLLRFSISLLTCAALQAQVYSPNLLRVGQPDPTDLKKFAAAICTEAHAQSDREKAEAIWRFFLTDGRYVKPGFWYHIAGWTYEEPSGEVLDPIKLLNSYGFGLCYHIAPLLAAVYDAAGFEDARVWFLTGHTVSEVFFDGSYHYFDSDMMGYNVPGLGSFRGKPVVSVHQLEKDGSIILGKLRTPNKVKEGVVDTPWYPADVAASAMKDLSDLFTTADNNHLFPYQRYASGHSMTFTLRPGEKLIRYFQPEAPDVYYLPYSWNGKQWTEFPRDVPEYKIRTADGPRSQKDARSWATGRIEYNPPDPSSSSSQTIIDMPSPYVVIDGSLQMNVYLQSPDSSLTVDTSVDGGQTWDRAAGLHAPFHGTWKVEPRIVVRSQNGRKTAISGSYGYQVRITREGKIPISGLHLLTRIQVNSRSLPYVTSGTNPMILTSGRRLEERLPVATPLDRAPASGFRLVQESGQDYLLPVNGRTGSLLYELQAPAGAELTGFDVGARFFKIRDGLVPDKLTAETRHTTTATGDGTASLAWSYSARGPFIPLWDMPSTPHWRDGQPIDRLLVWPQVFRQIHQLTPGTRTVYVRLSSSGPAIDSLRLALYRTAHVPAGQMTITQVWREGSSRQQHVETIDPGVVEQRFSFQAGAHPQNEAVIFENHSRP